MRIFIYRIVGYFCLLCTSTVAVSSEQPGKSVSLFDYGWSDPVNLTNHDYWDFDPDFSPDGSKIVFHSNRPPSPGNRGQIYVMEADGSNPQALTHTEGTNHGARWSPDGTHIIFTSERDGNPEIYMMKPDGTEQTNLTNNPDGYDSGAVWSPDGRHIAYFTGMEKPETDEGESIDSPFRYWNAEIYIMDLQTGERTRVTNSEMDDIYPAFSNDGKKLAFTSIRDGNKEIYTVNVDGTGLQRITNSPDSDLAVTWLPGDTHLTFRNNAGNAPGYNSNIYTVDLKKRTVKKVTDRPGTVYFSGNISPDKSSVIYSAFTVDESAFRGERADIYMVKKQ